MSKYTFFPKSARSYRWTALGALLLGAVLFSSADWCASEVRRTPLIIKDGGTLENPAVFDGKGTVIDLGEDISAAHWEVELTRNVHPPSRAHLENPVAR